MPGTTSSTQPIKQGLNLILGPRGHSNLRPRCAKESQTTWSAQLGNSKTSSESYDQRRDDLIWLSKELGYLDDNLAYPLQVCINTVDTSTKKKKRHCYRRARVSPHSGQDNVCTSRGEGLHTRPRLEQGHRRDLGPDQPQTGLFALPLRLQEPWAREILLQRAAQLHALVLNNIPDVDLGALDHPHRP